MEQRSVYRKWDVIWVDFPCLSTNILWGVHPAIVMSNNNPVESGFVSVVAGSEYEDETNKNSMYTLEPIPSIGIHKTTRFQIGAIRPVDVEWIKGISGSVVNTPTMWGICSAIDKYFEICKYLSYAPEDIVPHSHSDVTKGNEHYQQLAAKLAEKKVETTAAQPVEEKAESKLEARSSGFRKFHLIICPECRQHFVYTQTGDEKTAKCGRCRAEYDLKQTPIQFKCDSCGVNLTGTTNIPPYRDGMMFECRCGDFGELKWNGKRGGYLSKK